MIWERIRTPSICSKPTGYWLCLKSMGNPEMQRLNIEMVPIYSLRKCLNLREKYPIFTPMSNKKGA